MTMENFWLEAIWILALDLRQRLFRRLGDRHDHHAQKPHRRLARTAASKPPRWSRV